VYSSTKLGERFGASIALRSWRVKISSARFRASVQ
jgi:hypothetical protein